MLIESQCQKEMLCSVTLARAAFLYSGDTDAEEAEHASTASQAWPPGAAWEEILKYYVVPRIRQSERMSNEDVHSHPIV